MNGEQILTRGISTKRGELVVATIGRYSGINPFDQPGVALTKKLTLDYLRKINLN